MEIFLALNRCIEIGFSRISEWLFEGWRTWLWMFPPVLYGFYVFFIEKPVVFTGLFFAWFFYPHVGYLNESVEAQIVSHQDQFLFNRNRVIVATSLRSEIFHNFSVLPKRSTFFPQLARRVYFTNYLSLLWNRVQLSDWWIAKGPHSLQKWEKCK